MAEDLSIDLNKLTKELKKELKKFKKVAPTPKGFELAKEIKAKLKLIMKNHKKELNEKTLKNLTKSLSGIEFYIKNIERINKFKTKWNE